MQLLCACGAVVVCPEVSGKTEYICSTGLDSLTKKHIFDEWEDAVAYINVNASGSGANATCFQTSTEWLQVWFLDQLCTTTQNCPCGSCHLLACIDVG